MATIAFGAAASAKTTGTAGNVSISGLNPSGSNLIMWCMVTTGSGLTVTVKWNTTETFTSAASTDNNGYHGELFYLLNPTPGAFTVDITLSGTQLIDASAAWYTGAQQSGVPESSPETATNLAGSIAVSETTVADNAWIVAGMAGAVNFNPTSNDAVFTFRTGTNNANGADSVGLFDTNGPISPAGIRQADINAGALGYNGLIVASFAPATGGGAPPSNASLIIAPVGFS